MKWFSTVPFLKEGKGKKWVVEVYPIQSDSPRGRVWN
jgi:hypothetical protein